MVNTEVPHAELPEPHAGHDGGSWKPMACETVANWPAGAFAENLAVSATGDVFVSLHSHKRIERYDPRTGSLETYAELPAPVSGLCFDEAGVLWATGGAVGQAPGYVWRLLPGGVLEPWVEIPDAIFMNGCTLHGNALLVCESANGRVFSVDMQVKSSSVWLDDQDLRPSNPQMPGANGIQLKQGYAYISVTDRNVIMRARIQPDGSCGKLEGFLENIRADDFAFAESGAMYIATHPANSVVHVAADGSRATIAGPAEGLVGSTACAFGRAGQDTKSLYVTTSGGLFAPYHGVLQEARLVRIDVNEARL